MTPSFLNSNAAVLAVVALAGLAALSGFLVWRMRGSRATAEGSGAPRAPRQVEDLGSSSRYDRLRSALAKTHQRFAPLLARRRLGERECEELECVLLAADVGVPMTERLLRSVASSQGESVRAALEREVVGILSSASAGGKAESPRERPHVIMVVGVNGVGKTTSIGKLAHRYVERGLTTLLVAGDTFRAAATDQLAVWAQRVGVAVIRQQQGGDPGAVVYDGMRAALARKVDVVIVDTAGRLHTKTNLMEELRKVRRVIAREVPGAPHETLLVLDAVTGQNGLVQARSFLDHIAVTGIVLTKLDGTAKGGIALAIAGELGIPIRYIGVGEGVEDLREFDASEFAAALIGSSEGDVLDSCSESPVSS